MNDDVAILRQKVVKLVQLLADRGITVTQRGSRAYVESDHKGRPLRLNLPNIPDNASRDLIEAIEGFLDHEVAHLLFTDFDAVTAAHKINKGVGQLHNIVEDTFIERKMREKFPGSDHNLTKVANFYLIQKGEEALAKAEHPRQFLGILLVPAARAWAGQKVFQDWMSDKWHLLADYLEPLEPARDALPKVQNSWQALEVAKLMAAAVGTPPEMRTSGGRVSDSSEGETSEAESGDEGGTGAKSAKDDSESEEKPSKGKSKEKPEESDGKEKEKKDNEKSEGGSGEGADEDEGEDESSGGSGKGDKEKEEKEDSDGQDENEGTSDSADDDGKSAGGSDESDSDSEASGSSVGDERDDADADDDDGSKSAGGSDAGDDADGPSEGRDRGEDEEPKRGGTGGVESYEVDEDLTEGLSGNDFDAAIAEEITKESVEAMRAAEWSVFSTDWDRIEPLSGSEKYASRVPAFEEQTRGMVGSMQKEIERLMAARSRVVKNPGLRSGRLHGSNLHRLTRNDGRVFFKKEEHRSLATAVSLVVDCSGSMSGSPINLAVRAAYALSSVLDRLNIKHEVIGFTTGYPPVDYSAQFSEEKRRTGVRYSRTEIIYMPIFKGFDERLTPKVKRRFVQAVESRFLRNNIDGECVAIAGRRLMQQQAERRVMMVLSDGNPSFMGDVRGGYVHLKKVVQDLNKAKVETLGIGIMDNSVKAFYDKHVVINRLEELPGEVMLQLRKILL